MSSYIELEPFFDDQGVLLVRDKVTKKIVHNLKAVSVSNDVETMPYKILDIKVASVGKIECNVK
ncbi:hypothetical protein GCM10007161_13340 [Ignatzschineria indica]|uniref:Uncharacterized protein n=1 Tax=Ignatzschineria indica TaxID=472583 RepID=A0A2U2AJX6_9GAMM|nr:hypothetical protein [Ignatzschineria indica]PWD83069.1 hypothetical protein DC082_06495 [Ignatzschineria indica]GGZ83206.1 hypothetical protein GCM10007161_13340 [Ignatzschineria indica]